MSKTVKGSVVSGIGVGSRFMGLDWVERQIHEKLGFVPYAGTLNMKMDGEATDRYQSFIEEREGVSIEPLDDSYSLGKCFRARINGRVDGAIIIPLVPGYPRDQVEIIAPVNLREFLGLDDGNEVTVEIQES